MRGSPLLRTLVVLAVLLLTGLGLARLTAPVAQKPGASAGPELVEKPATKAKASFEILLSAKAKEVTLDGGSSPLSFQNTAEPVNGSLELEGEHPVISLRVTWSDTSPGHRFAKVRLEIPGKDTVEHVFTSAGDIDDIWEPLP